MAEKDFKRKLTTVFSADVVGYSRLMGENEAATVKTLETYKQVMFSLITQHRGRVVDSPGDNILAEFASVVDAVQCGVSVQKELQARNGDLPENRKMEFRIGINLGDVIEEEGRIYGDGVNIAARLESLADPGGICVSKTAFDHIESKLPLGYQFLGEQTVKNIVKPVGAYKVLMEPRVEPAVSKGKRSPTRIWRRKGILASAIVVIIAIIGLAFWHFYLRVPKIEPASEERMAFPLPDKPSIAVLPFTNMSGDPEQDYIGDGLSENIISALSASSGIFVISFTSTFTYKGKPVKIQQVAEDLGVQYVLEGSVQKSGDRLRVTAQLIDALTGHHLWSEKYDREMKEFFDLQDEITKKIFGSLLAELNLEGFRLAAKSTENLEALIHYIKGVELYFDYNREANARAREHFEAALKLDPEYVPAMALLSGTYYTEVLGGWTDCPRTTFKRAFELAQKAKSLDDQNPWPYLFLPYYYLDLRQHEKAITAAKRAITLSPNFAAGYGVFGRTLFFYGRFDEAITNIKKAYRLDPHLHPQYLEYLHRSYALLGRYEEALKVINQYDDLVRIGKLPPWQPPFSRATVYVETGREEEARALMAEALKIAPMISVELVKKLQPFKNPADLQRVLDILRKAGLPEKAPTAVQ